MRVKLSILMSLLLAIWSCSAEARFPRGQYSLSGFLIPGASLPDQSTATQIAWAPIAQPAQIGTSATVSISSDGTNTTVTQTAHGYLPGQAVQFNGTLPASGMKTNVIYYVRSAGLSTNSYQLSPYPIAYDANLATTAGTYNSVTAFKAGFNDNAVGVWDEVPFTTRSGLFKLCVYADHISGIDRVEFLADGGSTLTVRAATVGNSGVNVPEYCAITNDSLWADGKHEIRAIVYPNVGWPRVMQTAATVTFTSVSGGILQVNHPAHGYEFAKPIQFDASASSALSQKCTIGSTVLCFVCGEGMTPNSYQISTTQTFSAVGDGTACVGSSSTNVTITVGSTTVINQTNTYTAGQPLVFTGTLPTGMSIGTAYYVRATGLSGSSYQISANPPASDAPLVTSGTASSVKVYQAPIMYQGAFSGNVYALGENSTTGYAWGGFTEGQLRAGNSLWINTNSGGTLPVPTPLFVDNTLGSDSNNCKVPVFTSGSNGPCLTLTGAINSTSARVLHKSNITTDANDANGCTVFRMTATNPFAKNAPLAFDAISGTVTGTLGLFRRYWVDPNVNYSTTTMSVDLYPGGPCLQNAQADPGNTGLSGLGADTDLSDLIIYVVHSGQYDEPLATGGFLLPSTEGWVTIAPYGSATAENAWVNGSTSNSARTDKLHLQITSAPAISGGTSIGARGNNITWFEGPVDGSINATASSNSPYDTHSLMMANASTTNGRKAFCTDATIKYLNSGCVPGVLERNSTNDYVIETPFGLAGIQAVFNNTVSHHGIYYWFVQATAPTTSTDTSIQVDVTYNGGNLAPGTGLPQPVSIANFEVRLLNGVTGGNPFGTGMTICPPSCPAPTVANLTGTTLNLNGPLGTTYGNQSAGQVYVIYSTQHSGIFSLNATSQMNVADVGNTATNQIASLGMFSQNRPVGDWSFRNNSYATSNAALFDNGAQITSGAGFNPILGQAPTYNLMATNNSFSGGSATFSSNVVNNTKYVPNDNYFINNTCTNPAQGFTNTTLSGINNFTDITVSPPFASGFPNGC